MSTRDEINEAVRLMLATATAKTWYLGRVTDTSPPQSYGVLYPMNAGPGTGGMEDGEEERDFFFQCRSVGIDLRQSAHLGSKTEAAMTAKKAGGGYVHDIPLTGHTVVWRLVQALGATVSTGESLWQTDDTYTLRIGRDHA